MANEERVVCHPFCHKEMSLPAMSIIYLSHKVFAAVRESRFEAATATAAPYDAAD